MIEVEKLSKRFGGHTAVSELSFSVPKGAVVGFLGPNGAGKSTTMRVLAGVLAPTMGSVRVNGLALGASENAAFRATIGYMSEGVPLHPEMRVLEYLRFRAEIKGVSVRSCAAYIDEAMHLANVVDVANVTIGNLSKGYRQRVGLADALVAKPPVLLLDEPTAGLDPNQIRDVRRVLAALAGDVTVLLSTHILSEVESVCSQAIVIDKGRLVASGTLENIRDQHASQMLGVVASLSAAEADQTGTSLVKSLTELSIAQSVNLKSCKDGVVVLEITLLKQGASFGQRCELIAKALVAHGAGIRELKPVRSSLEDVFSRLTQQDGTSSIETAEMRS
jgi:ABC-2 type transport system ATP-binding protein